ncbi:transposase [Streptomyces sp. ACA25]|uniref:transposase n=1 Tax=Streptomyces sp. ACA25 TaxID=3022596 RepID=UPI0023071D76|nr:transposase [Streptomyces sp. ACA25]MDB1090089.1 transposase [Streptomyces sp. ACA25]
MDQQWAFLQLLLPSGKPGRPPGWTRRQLIDGMRFRVRTGIPWRETFTALQARADAKGLITRDLNVDSTVCRAHQHTSGPGKQGDLQEDPPGGIASEPDDDGLGARTAA